MGVLLWAVRILIVLLILRIVLRWFAERRLASTRRARARGPERLGGHLVKDPQCGTFVAETSAIRAAGQVFCSSACRDAWMASAGNVQRRAAR